MASDIEILIDRYLEKVFASESNNALSFFMEPIEEIIIRKVLTHSNGNRSKAAKILGISRSTLNYKIKLVQQRTKQPI